MNHDEKAVNMQDTYKQGYDDGYNEGYQCGAEDKYADEANEENPDYLRTIYSHVIKKRGENTPRSNMFISQEELEKEMITHGKTVNKESYKSDAPNTCYDKHTERNKSHE